mgnify:CR=1 FL=1
MELQTKIRIPTSQTPIGYESQVALWGSCFSAHMGDIFKQAQFRSDSNPFGVIFNPMAMAPLFERMASGTIFQACDFFEFQEKWHSFAFHSELSQPSASEAVKAANQAMFGAIEFIKASSHLIITLGSAWGYVLVGTAATNGQGSNFYTAPSESFDAPAESFVSPSEAWVANCHKQPAARFVKKMATQGQLQDALQRIQRALKQLNPKIHLLLTVSPVRHLKDGLQENSRSKAALLTAVHDFIESQHPNTQAELSYFPSYEIQMDELRDYRFYTSDMAHPSEQAVAYIWERFKAVTMTAECLEFMDRVSKVQRDMNHRPFQEKSAAHNDFKSKVKENIRDIQLQYPWMFLETNL